MKPRFMLALIVFLLAGCQGVKFAPAPVNQPLPDAFTKRALYPAGVAGYEFQDLVGNVLSIKEPEDPIRVGVVRPPGYVVTVIPITDPNNYYRSRIQLGAQAQGKYLAFAANFSAEQMAEITLIDIARSGISIDQSSNWTSVLTQLSDWVRQHPKVDPSIKRVWVKAAVLSRRVYQAHTKIDADASGQAGDVVGVQTGVYRKSEADIKSVDIGFEAFDVDRLVDEIKAINPGDLRDPKMQIFDRTQFLDTIRGSIRNN